YKMDLHSDRVQPRVFESPSKPLHHLSNRHVPAGTQGFSQAIPAHRVGLEGYHLAVGADSFGKLDGVVSHVRANVLYTVSRTNGTEQFRFEYFFVVRRAGLFAD